jgi:hypothetical protein
VAIPEAPELNPVGPMSEASPVSVSMRMMAERPLSCPNNR